MNDQFELAMELSEIEDMISVETDDHRLDELRDYRDELLAQLGY